MAHLGKIVLSCALLLGVADAIGEDSGWAARDYEYANDTLKNFYDRYQWNLVDPTKRAMRQNRSAGSTSGSGASTRLAPAEAVTNFRSSGRPIAPAKLASSYPQGSRAQVEKFFGQTLEAFHQIESQFGLARNDLAGALAAFLAGNYMAYRNEPFPDRHFKPLVQQLRGSLAANLGLNGASDAEKQELYESLAIVGTQMALTREALQKKPDAQTAANMRSAARGYLSQTLRLDPDAMRITEQGLVFR